MSNTPDLFDAFNPHAMPQEVAPLRRMARASDPESSHAAAAEHLASGANAAQRAACLAVMRTDSGLTSDEIAEAAGLERHAAARRLPELERDGLVRRGPIRLSMVGGRSGVTWTLVEPKNLER
jgi:predicted ArsR family transcriptional regulator